jgi:glycosyltransferase involved in cell wall biosynthesis
VKNETRVAIAIPAYQAASSIGDVVRRSLAVLPSVLVIDDGSTDGTGDAARTAGAEVRRHERNRGKGAGLQTAFEILLEREYDGVVTLDADGQHLPGEVHNLLSAAEDGADMVLGTRAHLFDEMGTLRRISNRTSSCLISFLAGAELDDIQTGFRYYSRRLLEEVNLFERGFDAESAVIVRAARQGFRIESVPVRMGFTDGRETSHYHGVSDSFRIARSVLRARFC